MLNKYKQNSLTIDLKKQKNLYKPAAAIFLPGTKCWLDASHCATEAGLAKGELFAVSHKLENIVLKNQID